MVWWISFPSLNHTLFDGSYFCIVYIFFSFQFKLFKHQAKTLLSIASLFAFCVLAVQMTLLFEQCRSGVGDPPLPRNCKQRLHQPSSWTFPNVINIDISQTIMKLVSGASLHTLCYPRMVNKVSMVWWCWVIL